MRMIATLREWFNPKDPLVGSQIFLVAFAAFGFVDYFNALFIYVLEIPLGLVIGLIGFSRSSRTVRRYLVEIVRQSALLAVLLLMLLAVLHGNDRSPLLDHIWRKLRTPLLAGTVYYVVQFAPLIRNALRADAPVVAWLRSAIVPQFPLWFVLLLSLFGTFALSSLRGGDHADSIAAHVELVTALTALTATVRILLTRAFARAAVAAQIEQLWVDSLGPNSSTVSVAKR
jgi:hypothetical protein